MFRPRPLHSRRGRSPPCPPQSRTSRCTPIKTRQTIEGFGGCFNEKGWQALSVLDDAGRRDVMRRLFDPIEGLGFTVCRVPIGASDYALDRYTLNETPATIEMKHFSIERDRAGTHPVHQGGDGYPAEAQALGLGLDPAHLDEGQPDLRLGHLPRRPEDVPTPTPSTSSSSSGPTDAEGLPVEAVAVQNEPGTLTHYPSCDWTAVQYLTFIRDHLGPLFRAEGLADAIMLGTFNQPTLLATLSRFFRSRTPDARLPRRHAVVRARIRRPGQDGRAWPHRLADRDRLRQLVLAAGSRSGQAAERHRLRRLHLGEDPRLAQGRRYGLRALEHGARSRREEHRCPETLAAELPDHRRSADARRPLHAHVRRRRQFLKVSCRLAREWSKPREASTDAVAFLDPVGRIVVVLYNQKIEDVRISVRARGAVYGVDMPARSFASLVVDAR